MEKRYNYRGAFHNGKWCPPPYDRDYVDRPIASYAASVINIYEDLHSGVWILVPARDYSTREYPPHEYYPDRDTAFAAAMHR